MKKIKFITALIFISFIIFGNMTHVLAKVSNKANENFANIVFFAYYNGTKEEIEADKKYYKDNSSELIEIYNKENDKSFTQYLKEISYGKFNVKNIFPQLKNGVIEPIKLNLEIEKSYNGNDDIRVIDQIIEKYPSIGNQIIDYDNDNYIDNITIILKSRDGYTASNSNSTFTSHKSIYPSTQKYLNKYIGTYNIIGTASIDNNKAGVIAHEFLHSIGYPDLYRGSMQDDNPVLMWDIMASANAGLPYPLAFLRKDISKWIDIDTITESTNNLRLDEQSNKNGNQAYILKSPFNEYEYFVVEYRKKCTVGSSCLLDSGIGRSGIIVYRVDTTVEKLSNRFGKTGIYVFRPSVYGEERTNLYYAALAANTPMLGVTDRINTIGTSNMDKGLSDGALTFSDGTNSGIVIKNVSEPDGDYMTLDVEIPNKEDYDLWSDSNLTDITESNSSNKSVEMILHNNKIYAISFDSNKIYTQALENNIWKIKNSNTTLSSSYYIDKHVIEYNNKIYLLYCDGLKLEILVWNDNNNSWSFVTKTEEAINSFGVNVFNNKLYITGVGSEYGNFNSGFFNMNYIYEFSNNNLSLLGSTEMQSGGQPKIVLLNNKIYSTIRSADGTIKLYLFENGSFTNIPIEFSSQSYDIKVLNNKLYLVLGQNSSEKLKLHMFDGTNWSNITTNYDATDPTLVVSQENLYILVNQSNSLLVYSLDEKNKSLNKEGNTVDFSGDSLNSTLVSIDDLIYVGIKKTTDNKIIVKYKGTVNKLLSLTIIPPKKVSYMVGDSIDKTDLKVLANYVKEQKEVTNYTISNFDTTKPGIYNATVTYEGVSNTFSYEVFEEQTSKTVLKPGLYTIHSALNGNKVLDVSGGLNKSGANVQLYTANGTKAQTWKITEVGDGYYEIASAINNKLVLDVSGGSSANGANVQIYMANGTNAQRWLIKDAGGGYYYIVSKISGKNLDIAGANTNDGTNAQIYVANGTNAQKFKFKKIETTTKPTTTTKFEGNYVIHSALNNNKVLDVSGGLNKSGANVQLYTANGTKAQTWKITEVGDGYYEIASAINNKLVLDVSGGSSANGANVQIYMANGTNAQRWLIKDAGGGYYYIVSKISGKNLDIAGANTNDGTNAQIYVANGTNAQKFKLQKK